MLASDGTTAISRTPGTTGSVAFDYETDDIPIVMFGLGWAIGERSRHREDTEQRERLHQASLKVQEQNHMMLMAIGANAGADMPVDDGHSDAAHEEKDKTISYMGTVIAGICVSLMALITFLVKKKKK